MSLPRWMVDREYYLKHREEKRRYSAARYGLLRREILTYYSPNGVLGCSCPKCDVILEDFLTIDHIDGKGRQQIEGTGMARSTFYLWLKKQGFPPGFQTLCFNCNCARGKVNSDGICPHMRIL